MNKIKLNHGTWVIVMDGERALFLRNEGDGLYPNLQVFREFEHDNPPTREQGTERPGRFSDGVSGHRSAVQDTDWHRLGKEEFAREIAERLYRHAHRNRFDSLVLVAPPQVLGEIRKRLHGAVTGRIVGEVDKDLTGHRIDKIEKLLSGN